MIAIQKEESDEDKERNLIESRRVSCMAWVVCTIDPRIHSAVFKVQGAVSSAIVASMAIEKVTN